MGFELTTFGTYTLGRKQPLLKTLSHLGSYTLEINFIFLNNSKNYKNFKNNDVTAQLYASWCSFYKYSLKVNYVAFLFNVQTVNSDYPA